MVLACLSANPAPAQPWTATLRGEPTRAVLCRWRLAFLSEQALMVGADYCERLGLKTDSRTKEADSRSKTTDSSTCIHPGFAHCRRQIRAPRLGLQKSYRLPPGLPQQLAIGKNPSAGHISFSRTFSPGPMKPDQVKPSLPGGSPRRGQGAVPQS